MPVRAFSELPCTILERPPIVFGMRADSPHDDGATLVVHCRVEPESIVPDVEYHVPTPNERRPWVTSSQFVRILPVRRLHFQSPCFQILPGVGMPLGELGQERSPDQAHRVRIVIVTNYGTIHFTSQYPRFLDRQQLDFGVCSVNLTLPHVPTFAPSARIAARIAA